MIAEFSNFVNPAARERLGCSRLKVFRDKKRPSLTFSLGRSSRLVYEAKLVFYIRVMEPIFSPEAPFQAISLAGQIVVAENFLSR